MRSELQDYEKRNLDVFAAAQFRIGKTLRHKSLSLIYSRCLLTLTLMVCTIQRYMKNARTDNRMSSLLMKAFTHMHSIELSQFLKFN